MWQGRHPQADSLASQHKEHLLSMCAFALDLNNGLLFQVCPLIQMIQMPGTSLYKPDSSLNFLFYLSDLFLYQQTL